MWHASIAPQRLTLPVDMLRALAHAELNGVGDSSLGEWEELGVRAFHLRRRLSAEEQRHVGAARDVRNHADGYRRAQKMQRFLPAEMRGQVI